MRQMYTFFAVLLLFYAPLSAGILHNHPDEIIKPLGPFYGMDNSPDLYINLSDYFTPSSDTSVMDYHITWNSNQGVANAMLNSDTLVIDFLSAGQTTVSLQLNENGILTEEKVLIGVGKTITGNWVPHTFEDLNPGTGQYLNGSDLSGGYQSGMAFLPNFFDQSFGSWTGWAVSSVNDPITPGWGNQYAAIAGAGFDTLGSESTAYTLAFVSTNWLTLEMSPAVLRFADSSAHQLKGLYATNNTYASMSMEHGDAFAKKFGGETGKDPDWFKLMIWGMKNGLPSDTVEFYLADFRFGSDSNDYIVKTWQWIDLEAIEKADSLLFMLASSDAGAWGMNTPSYFCMDQLYIGPDLPPALIQPMADLIMLQPYADTTLVLSEAFQDPDDPGPYNYSVVHISNPGILDASIQGSDLHLVAESEYSGISDVVVRVLSNGKAATDTFRVTLSAPSRVGNSEPAFHKLYPNPFADNVVLQTINSNQDTRVTVYNLQGIQVTSRLLNGSSVIDLSRLTKGTYLFLVQDENEVTSHVLVKN